jgi:hypothetical protein
MRKPIGILVIGFLALIALIVGVFLPPKSRTDQINREEGDRIVNALLAYERANHAYPSDLKELVPKFIPQIPQQHRSTGSLKPFHYELGDNNHSFVLSYDEAPIGPFTSDATFEFDSKVRDWKNHVY